MSILSILFSHNNTENKCDSKKNISFNIFSFDSVFVVPFFEFRISLGLIDQKYWIITIANNSDWDSGKENPTQLIYLYSFARNKILICNTKLNMDFSFLVYMICCYWLLSEWIYILYSKIWNHEIVVFIFTLKSNARTT